MLMKEKRNGTIKAWVCCNRIIKRNYMTKEETRPPTAMQESLVVTCILYEMEGRDVAVADTNGAFLQTEMVHGNRIVHVRVCGVLADLLVKIYRVKFSDNVVLECGTKVIYADIKKDLYGALISSLLFWRYLSGALESWGFKPNPYGS